MTDAERLAGGFASSLAKAPFGIAPEAANDLAEIGVDAWELVFRDGDGTFKALLDRKEIAVYFAGLLSLWAVAKAALIVANAGMVAARTAGASADIGPLTGEAFALLSAAEQLIRNPAASWPSAFAKPDPAAAQGSTEWADNNLFMAAAGWVMLHEVAHVYLNHHDATTQALLKSQEHEADEWATKWVLNGVTDDKIREFRILAVGVGIVWIGLIDKVKGKSNTHPHAAERLTRCEPFFCASELSPSLEMLSYVLKAFFDPATPVQPVDTPAEAFVEELIRYGRLER